MPRAEFMPSEVGTDAAGFRTTGSPQSSLRVEVWGYWTAEIAQSFMRDAAALLAKLTQASELVIDATRLKPQAAEGQEALRVVFRALATASFGKAALRSDNVLTRMQLTRLLRECELDGRVSFE
jgi:hypothetical protein